MAEFLGQLSNEHKEQLKAHFLKEAASSPCSSSRMGANVETPKFSIPRPNVLKLGATQVELDKMDFGYRGILGGVKYIHHREGEN